MSKTSKRGTPPRDRKAPAHSTRKKQPDAIVLITLTPEAIRLHPEAATGFSAWRDVPRVALPPEAVGGVARAVVDAGPCLAVRVEGEVRIISGFDVVHAAATHGLPVEAVVLPEGSVSPDAIRRRALSALARLPAAQLDPVFGHAAWLEAMRRWVPEPIIEEWLGGPLTRAGAARLLGVCRDRLDSQRLGRPS